MRGVTERRYMGRDVLMLTAFTLVVCGAVGAVMYYGFPQFFPKWYGYMTAFFYASELTMIVVVNSAATKIGPKNMVNLYMAIRVIKMFMALVFVGIYALAVKEGVKSFALVFMILYFLYIIFDAMYMSQLEKRLKRLKQ